MSLLRRVIARVRTMRNGERVVVAFAAMALPIASAAIRTLGVRRVVRAFDALGARSVHLALPEPLRVVQLVARVGDLARYPVACLERSLVAWLLLRWGGRPAVICVGTATKPKFAAHAWIEIEGAAVGEPAPAQQRFATLLRVGGA